MLKTFVSGFLTINVFFAFSSLLGIASPSDLDVTDIQDNTLTVRWTPARGPITGYRVTGTPKGGQGPTFSELVGPGEPLLNVLCCFYSYCYDDGLQELFIIYT